MVEKYDKGTNKIVLVHPFHDYETTIFLKNNFISFLSILNLTHATLQEVKKKIKGILGSN